MAIKYKQAATARLSHCEPHCRESFAGNADDQITFGALIMTTESELERVRLGSHSQPRRMKHPFSYWVKSSPDVDPPER